MAAAALAEAALGTTGLAEGALAAGLVVPLTGTALAVPFTGAAALRVPLIAAALTVPLAVPHTSCQQMFSKVLCR